MGSEKRRERALRKQLMVWLTMGCFVMQTGTSFATFVADVQAPANQRPSVERTASGIDLIQITAPTAGGVSRNAYTDFSVPQSGVVLNNAYGLSQTKLAGFVAGNPNLARGHASVIVNEVTSTTPTDMKGFIEVAGNKAAVVVANPNGITVDGGGFINTSQGLLTTGRPEYDPAGNLQHIRVTKGTVAVTGAGLNATEADKLAILSRAVQVNAGVWAKEMAVRTGNNVVNSTTLEATPLAPTDATTTAPAVSLDVAAIGGMYANQISLVGTEVGVGVNMAGRLQGTDQLTLDTKGNLVHSGTTLAGKAATITANQVDNTGALTSAGTLTVGAQSDLTLSGTITSNGDMHLTSSGAVHNKTNVTAGGTLTVSGNHIENTNTHALTGNAVTVQAKDSVTNTGLINSATKTSVSGHTVTNTGTGRIYGDRVHISGNTVVNNANAEKEEELLAKQAMVAQKKQAMDTALANLAKAQEADTKQSTRLTRSDLITNEQAFTTAKDAFLAEQQEAQTLYDALHAMPAGIIAAHTALNVEANTITNTVGATLLSEGDMRLAGKDNEKAKAIVNHGGHMEAQGNVVVKSHTVTNSNAQLNIDMTATDWTPSAPDLITIPGMPQKLRSEVDEKEFGPEGQLGPNKFSMTYVVHPDVYGKEQELSPVTEAGSWTRPPVYNYAQWDSPNWQLVKEKLGITPPTAPPPKYQTDTTGPIRLDDGQVARPLTPAYIKWKADFDAKIKELEEKIPAYNAPIHEANRTLKVETVEYDLEKQKKVTPTLVSSAPGVILAGKDMAVDGALTNADSTIVVGGNLQATTAVNNVSTPVKGETITKKEHVYSHLVRVAAGSKRSRHNDITTAISAPALTDVALPTTTTKDHTAPMLQGTDMVGVSVPNAALYNVQKDPTANYLIETDPAFTDKRKFLTSDYMLHLMNIDPDSINKRLGDGYYEQNRIREQIIALTGNRYLTGYTTDEAEYKALMHAGATFAKAYNLKPGIALTKEQMAALTSDIVWLVNETVTLPSGEQVQVLVPKVYLHSHSPAKLTASGALISASNVVMDLKEGLQNEGTIAAKNTLVVEAPTLQVGSTGQLIGKEVGLHTTADMAIQGRVVADSKAVLQSDKDLKLATTTYTTRNAAGSHRLGTNQMAGVAVRGDEGVLVVSAKGDLTASGAQLVNLSKKGATILEAGHNLTLESVHTDNYAQGIIDNDNYLKLRDTHDVGTTIQTNGDIYVQAKQDLSAKAAYVASENGVVNVAAGRDISLTSGKDRQRTEYGIKFKESGFLSSATTTIKRDNLNEAVTGTTLSGQTTNVVAGRDIHAQSANILGTHDVTVAAGNKITTSTTAKQDYAEDYMSVKKSGLLSAGGIGFMIGTKKTTDAASEDANTTVGAVIGSTEGNVTIQANDTVQLKKANVLAKKDISISGSDVTLEGDTNTRTATTLHEVKTSGLTVALGGTVMSAVNTAIDLKNHAKNRNDKRLATLEYVEAGRSLKDGVNEIRDYTQLTKQVKTAENIANQSMSDALHGGSFNQAAADQRVADNMKKNKIDKADKLINLSVSIGSSSSKSETKVHEITYEGGKLVAGNGIQVSANSADTAKGNLTTIAETITGKKVSLQADNNVNLLAGTNTTKITEDNKNKGWSVGTSIGLASGSLMGLDASAYKATENGVTDMTTHTGTTVTGADSVSISSGQDTNIIGSKVKGNTVAMNVGKDLNITSLQDTKTYKNRSSSSGMSISTNFTAVGTMGSISSSKSKMDSTYASVTDQAGIYAGNGGFTINTKGTTTLTGAIVDSTLTGKVANDKNTLTTNSLIVNDIKNEASYSTSEKGYSFTGVSNFDKLSKKQQNDIYKELGISALVSPSLHDDASSVTKSVIGDGNIFTGNSNVPVKETNRNIEHSLNTLGEIFDKTKVEERKILIQKLSKYSNEAIHKIAEKQGWKDGSPEKIALHAVTSGILSELGNQSFGTGAIVGGTNEALINTFKKLASTQNGGKLVNSQNLRLLSGVWGYAVGKATGTNPETSQFIAQDATKYNSTGSMKKNMFYRFVDFNGIWWQRTPYGDSYLNGQQDAVEDGTIFVMQRKEPGFQKEGHEYEFHKSTGGATYIKEPMGLVEPMEVTSDIDLLYTSKQPNISNNFKSEMTNNNVFETNSQLENVANISHIATTLPFEVGSIYADPKIASKIGNVTRGSNVVVSAAVNSVNYSGDDFVQALKIDLLKGLGIVSIAEGTGALVTESTNNVALGEYTAIFTALGLSIVNNPFTESFDDWKKRTTKTNKEKDNESH